MSDMKNYENISSDMFRFVQMDASIHDKKLETKSRGYFADAFLRFKKNKSSLVAGIIILFLLLFAIFSPIISTYSVKDKDPVYVSFPLVWWPHLGKWCFEHGTGIDGECVGWVPLPD